MRWAPINRQLSIPDETDVLIWLTEQGVPTVTIISIVTDLAVFLGFGPGEQELDATNALQLNAGEGYAESGILVSDKIRFKNVVPGQQPTVRGVVWGR